MLLLLLLTLGAAWAEPVGPADDDPAASPEELDPLPPPPVPELPVIPLSVSLGRPILVGDLGIEEVITVFSYRVPAVKKCFGPFGGNWEGEVLVRVTVGSNGVPASSTLATSTLEAPDIEACITRALAGARYGEQPDREPVTIVYSIFIAPE